MLRYGLLVYSCLRTRVGTWPCMPIGWVHASPTGAHWPLAHRGSSQPPSSAASRTGGKATFRLFSFFYFFFHAFLSFLVFGGVFLPHKTDVRLLKKDKQKTNRTRRLARAAALLRSPTAGKQTNAQKTRKLKRGEGSLEEKGKILRICFACGQLLIRGRGRALAERAPRDEPPLAAETDAPAATEREGSSVQFRRYVFMYTIIGGN